MDDLYDKLKNKLIDDGYSENDASRLAEFISDAGYDLECMECLDEQTRNRLEEFLDEDVSYYIELINNL